MTLAYWHWLVFGMLLAGFEIFVPSFTALWFGLGAIVVGLLMLLFPGLPLFWQVLIWTLASAAFTGGWVYHSKYRSPNRTKAGLSREAIVGETALVIIAPEGERRGMLRFATPKLGSEEWEFICDQPVVVGDRVGVKDVSGNTLIVGKR
jgi:hypothetical protein